MYVKKNVSMCISGTMDFFRFVINRDDDCVADLAKLTEHYGEVSDLSKPICTGRLAKVRAGDRCFL